MLKIWVNEKKKGKTFGLKLFNSIPPINKALFTRNRKFLKPHIVLHKLAFHSQGNHTVNPLTALDSSDLVETLSFLKYSPRLFLFCFFRSHGFGNFRVDDWKRIFTLRWLLRPRPPNPGRLMIAIIFGHTNSVWLFRFRFNHPHEYATAV